MEGTWLGGKLNGKGKIETPEYEYNGSFKDNLFHG